MSQALFIFSVACQGSLKNSRSDNVPGVVSRFMRKKVCRSL